MELRIKDSLFRKIIQVAAYGMIVLVVVIFITLLLNSLPSLKKFGVGFFSNKTWNPVRGEFGAFPFLIGTLITSFLALLVSLPFSLSLSIFLGEYIKEGFISSLLKSAVELLAGIPSVIYGFWGIFVLVPLIQKIEVRLNVPPYGVGILTSSVLLAIMIIPYAASLGREVIQMVPSELKEAAYSLGATRFEVTKKVIFPYARSGIIAGILLALGRALGETMAVTMVIGNANILPKSIFSPSNTMASIIANEFTEAVSNLYVSALVEIGLLLFLVTTVINIIGRLIIKKLNYPLEAKEQ